MFLSYVLLIMRGCIVIPISQKLPLSEAAEAHAAAEKGASGKILLVV
jgi:NADPH:quinone reductase-like Zn-dependent oxidoreductase